MMVPVVAVMMVAPAMVAVTPAVMAMAPAVVVMAPAVVMATADLDQRAVGLAGDGRCGGERRGLREGGTEDEAAGEGEGGGEAAA
ncbi:putative low-complexity protein [Methylobacterium sp. BE186]|uniref:hypothetical protein n=1 Tax=Methylobacterium sp. BE186 TaxID=2817715 RepID=UPI00286680B4|nr:hypothetical protein [Methylobacterium sp. BE186]MDR7039819.1 putative low-complexity protein [Methylobacterium sp. BE186]